MPETTSGPAIVVTRDRPAPKVAVVAVRGQIDLYSAPEFKESVTVAIEEGAKHVIVDLTQTDFMDSTALGVLVGARKRLHAGDGTLDIVCPDPGIRRLFEISGLSDRFALYDSREQVPAAH